MNWIIRYLRSSIGRKQMMGLTGIGLYLYLFVHLLGNVGMLGGAETFNRYSHFLLHNLASIVVPIEIGLLFIFIVHIWLAIALKRENRAARPVPYQSLANHGKKTAYSRTMFLGGLWILLFALIHVAHFKYGAGSGKHMITYQGLEVRDLYRTMIEGFASPWYTLFYVVSMLVVGFHLAHGVQSSFQSLGFNHPKYTPVILFISKAYALFIAGGFALLCVWAHFQQGAIR